MADNSVASPGGGFIAIKANGMSIKTDRKMSLTENMQVLGNNNADPSAVSERGFQV